jgi:hypothetical protein
MMLWPRTDPRTTKMGKLLQFELEKMIGIHSFILCTFPITQYTPLL